jgi:peptide deformylase
MHKLLANRIAQVKEFDKIRAALPPESRGNMPRVLLAAHQKDLTVLRKQGIGVHASTEQVTHTARKMQHLLSGELGRGAAGLAACQIGDVLPLFAMVHRHDDTVSDADITTIQFWWFPDATAEDPGVVGEGEAVGEIEGCLSVLIPYDAVMYDRLRNDPKLIERLKVKRPQKARVKGYTQFVSMSAGAPGPTPAAWTPRETTYEGFDARCAQHEYDHLRGRMHFDYLSRMTRENMLKGRY